VIAEHRLRFVGVDVFFVISGFLISGIILDETRVGLFSLKRFYVRRVRRIFPALLLVLLASLLAGWWLFLPADFVRLGKQLAASAAFVSNFYLWFQSGYFSPDARTFRSCISGRSALRNNFISFGRW
jgi:peptidoglycan/LPS O-acetylase OafA/YrhL